MVVVGLLSVDGEEVEPSVVDELDVDEVVAEVAGTSSPQAGTQPSTEINA